VHCTDAAGSSVRADRAFTMAIAQASIAPVSGSRLSTARPFLSHPTGRRHAPRLGKFSLACLHRDRVRLRRSLAAFPLLLVAHDGAGGEQQIALERLAMRGESTLGDQLPDAPRG
jgi:hypothetical protein